MFTILREIDSVRRPNGAKARMFECRCECGAIRNVSLGNLRSGNSKSCGCRWRNPHANSPEHIVWRGMMARCNNPKSTGYSRYGGSGITVCSRWKVFKNFMQDMSPRPEGMTLDRIDGSKGYSPDNCRWVPVAHQSRNRKDNVILTHGGKSMIVAEWARHIGMKHVTLKNRLRMGWSVEDALTRAVEPRKFSRSDDFS